MSLAAQTHAQNIPEQTNHAAAETVCVKVDFNSPAGTIRRLNGVNLAAPLTGARQRDLSQDLKELDIPVTRLHDAALENAGMQLVDISRVFPIFSLDPQNPEHYYFTQTDDYIANCLATGSKVSYRLGESIEWSNKNYFVHPPKDYDKWADICVNIIRHYNEGWANGFKYNIEYWCIWEEPENVPLLWTGTWGDYIRLYVTTAKKIKQRFPNLKVGGPALGRVDPKQVDELLAECKRQNAPLDFFAWNTYQSSPEPTIAFPERVRKLLDERGFSKTELHLTEWNYFPGSFQKLGDPKHRLWLMEEMSGPNGAAFLGAVLSGWQDTPLDMGYYYTGSSGSFGLFTSPERGRAKKKCYFAMKAFNMMTKYASRVSARTPGNDKNIWVLAGRKQGGQAAILVSCFKSPARQIKLEIENYDLRSAKCKVYVIDGENDLQALDAVTISGSEITIPKPDGSAVFLVELM